MTGIDISHHQSSFPDGDWEFVVVKATEGMERVDPMLDSHWKSAGDSPRRGVYHYARPQIGPNGTEQAKFFADTALARGFVKDVDMWQLDIEGEKNEDVSPELWRQYIAEFMDAALGLLGKVGFLYIGWPFYRGIFGDDVATLERVNWWIPSYGPNDGNVHPFKPGVPTQLVVVHQFTSFGHLDQNRIVDTVKWEALTGAAVATNVALPDEAGGMRLIPRRAVAHPIAPGRIGYIAFKPSARTLVAFNGLDFNRDQDPHVWRIQEGFGLVTAQLLLPVRGPLSYAEAPDGGAVVITDDSDGGTFALPYRELAPQ